MPEKSELSAYEKGTSVVPRCAHGSGAPPWQAADMNQRSAGPSPDDSRRPVRPAPKAARRAGRGLSASRPFPRSPGCPLSPAVLMRNAPLIHRDHHSMNRCACQQKNREKARCAQRRRPPVPAAVQASGARWSWRLRQRIDHSTVSSIENRRGSGRSPLPRRQCIRTAGSFPSWDRTAAPPCSGM